ncbi:MAG: hypothetical protein AAGL96_19020 [Pseudomonadota bacterium]
MSGAIEQTPKQREIWAVLQQRAEFGFADLAEVGVCSETATEYLRGWVELGLIEQHRAQGTRRLYRPVALRAETALPGERDATPEGNMWRAMRRNRRFTVTDVACWANAGGVQVSVGQARAYCRQLAAAGILRLAKRRPRKGAEHVYVLADDLGPLAPHMRRVRAIFDPNGRSYRHADGAREA